MDRESDAQAQIGADFVACELAGVVVHAEAGRGDGDIACNVEFEFWLGVQITFGVESEPLFWHPVDVGGGFGSTFNF